MRRTLFALLLLSFIGLAAAPAQAAGAWPSLSAQLSQDRVQPGSALERLILANQDFSLLRADEVKDRNPLPPWLRVIWRKAHPEITYSPKDPTGGYPLVLKEVYEWMLAHQDLQPGKREPSRLATRVISESGEQRISGLQTSRRSESDIRVDPFDTTKIISASNNIGGSGMQAVYFSTNSGASWGQTTLPLVTGDAFHSDPTVDWTSDGTAWSTTIGINSAGTILHMRSYKSTNNGSTWTFDATFSGSQSSTDKQMIWADHSATSAFKDNLYAIWHNGAPVFMNRRTGPTGSWQTAIQVSGSETTGTGIGADVKTNSGGDLFGAWPDTGSQRIFVVKSTNGGVSYGTPTQIASTFGSFNITIPAMASRKPLIYVSMGTNKSGTKNNVYASWMDLSGDTGCTIPSNEPGTNVASTCKTRIFFSRSTNGGTSWSAPVKVNNQASKNDQFNQWLTVDDTTGNISIIYYDTVNDAGRKKTDVWYQSSTDDGATWGTPFKVTTAQTDETVSGADSGNQYGDYNALSGRAGTFFPSWTDRRNNANEEIWTAGIADSGATCTPPGAPTGVSATAASQTQINLSWSAVSGATEYHVLRSTTSGGPYTQVGSVTTTSFSDTGLTCNTAYFYVVRAATSPTCESANSVQVTATTQTCTTCTPPGAPTGVSATAVSQTQINVAWSAVTGATEYHILRSTTSGGPYTQVGSVTTTSFSDTGLTCNTTYFYVVRAATSPTCESVNSAQVSALTQACSGCTPTTLYTNGFETGSGLSDWTVGTFNGGSSASWRGIQLCTAQTGSNIFRYGGTSCTTNYTSNNFTFAQPKGTTGIVFGAAATTSRLVFGHRWGFESGFDGGTLTVSVDGLNYFYVPASAIISGTTYNGTTSTACPPSGAGGVSVFTGSQSTFVNTTFNLDAACNVATGLSTGCAGRTVYIGFTSISDCSVTSTGWFLDNVTVTDCQ